MIKKKSVSLKWKIFGGFLIFTGILLVMLWILQILCLNDFYTAVKRREIRHVTNEAMELLEQDGLEQSWETLDGIALDQEVSLLVTDTAGREIYCAQYNPRGSMDAISRETFLELYHQAKASGGETEIEYDGDVRWDAFDPLDKQGLRRPEPQKSVIHVGVIESQGQEVVLLVSAMLSPVDATVSTLKVQLSLLTVLLLFVSLLVAWLASRTIASSLIRLNEGAKELAKGNYQVTFQEADYKEVSQLSDTLNYAVKELAKTEDLQKELIANVSHDLRTPLTMIKAYGEVIRDLPMENTAENVQVIIDETDRLSSLVNDMLDVSQLEAGTITLHEEIFDLTALIREMVDRYEKLKSAEGYRFSFASEQHGLVRGDRDKMAQVICNLLNNAMNYTGEDKKVMVRQRIQKGHIRIDVQDTGAGITREEIPYVWDRYYKGKKSHKRPVAGTGLGLSIVQKILKLHGAVFGVESEKGMGADFWFEMPLQEIRE